MATYADSKPGAVSSSPARVTKPFVRKATGNPFSKSTALEKTQNPVSGFCYARNRVWDLVSTDTWNVLNAQPFGWVSDTPCILFN